MSPHLALTSPVLPPIPRASPVQSEPWFVYIVQCADGTYYTGIARNVRARISEHERGRGARYTRGRSPLSLRAHVCCPNKRIALQLEHAIKRLPRHEKILLIDAPTTFLKRARVQRSAQRRRGETANTQSVAARARAYIGAVLRVARSTKPRHVPIPRPLSADGPVILLLRSLSSGFKGTT